jgi:hypothetical protein
VAVRLEPGIYCVAVLLDVSAQAIPCGMIGLTSYANLGERAYGTGGGTTTPMTPFLSDGNQEIWQFCSDEKVTRVGKTYEVEKKAGEPATILSLFQRDGEEPARLYGSLPESYGFQKCEMGQMQSPASLEMWGVPPEKSREVLPRLLRGGKVLLWDEDGSYFMFELTPTGTRMAQSGAYADRMRGQSRKKRESNATPDRQ